MSPVVDIMVIIRNISQKIGFASISNGVTSMDTVRAAERPGLC